MAVAMKSRGATHPRTDVRSEDTLLSGTHLWLPVVVAACGGLFTTVLAWIILRRHDLIDDAYITARYADHIAHGHGWVWNVGAAPTDGTTAPLWTIVLALVRILPVPFMSCVLALNAVCYGSATFCASLITARFAGIGGAVLCTVLMTLLTFLLPSSAGMETPLYVALLLTSILAWQRERVGVALAAAALLPLVRGEGVLFTALLIIAMVHARPARWRLAVVTLLPFIGWEVFSLWQFHTLVPTSFLAKHAQAGNISDKLTWRSLLRYGPSSPTALWLLPAAVLGGIAARRHLVAFLLLVWLLVYAAFYLFVANVPNQPWYVLPIWWTLPIVAVGGLGTVIHRAQWDDPYTVLLPSASVVCLLLGLSGFLSTTPHVVHDAIATPLPRLTVFYEAAAYLNTQPPALVAAPEIGILGFYSRDPIVDLLGLVSPEVVPHLHVLDYTWVLRAERPRYVLVWGPMTPTYCTYDIACRIWGSAWFHAHYRVIRSWPHAGYALLRWM